MKKGKILFILHLPPPIHGAALMGNYIQNSEQIKNDFDAHFINYTSARNLQDIGRGGIGKLWRFVCMLFHIVIQVIKIRPHCICITPNASGNAFYKDFIVVQILKYFNQKIILHYHNKGIKNRENKKIDHWLYTLFFQNVKVILLAESLYSDIQKYVERMHIYICHNGIPSPDNTLIQHTEIKQDFRFLFLSNLLKDKGVIVLLNAIGRLKEKGYSFTCDMIGGETIEFNAQNLQQEIEKRGLGEYVHYHGAKFGEEKTAYLNTSHCFVLPTLNECFPIVLLEAMSHRLPCISTFEGAIPEMIKEGETGWLIEQGSSETLAKKMAWMIEHPDTAKEMGEKGEEVFRESFTISRFESTLRHILLSILQES